MMELLGLSNKILGLENNMFGFVKKKDYDLLKECIKNKEYMLHGTQLILKEQEK